MSNYYNNQKEEAIRLHGEGHSIKEIMQTVDLNYDAINRLLKAKGLKQTKKPHDAKAEILRLLNDDTNVKKVAFQTKTSATIVSAIARNNHLIETNFKYAGKVFETLMEKENYVAKIGVEVRKLAADGVTKKDIARKFGLSLKSIARFLDK